MLAARLVGLSLLIVLPHVSSAAPPDEDPVSDGKKASEWVNTLQNDASARKRALAAAALGKVWASHHYKDAVVNLGRSLRLDPSAAVRAQCAAVIAGLKPDDVRPIETDLIDSLKAEKEARVRKEITTALGRFPDVARKAVAPLTAVLKDADPAVRAAAADALARVGADAKAAAPELVPLLDDPDKVVRQTAIFALGRISPENASFVAAALIKRFGAEKEVELRRELVVSVKLLGDKSGPVIGGLVSALRDPDDETAAAAAAALGAFGTEARSAADAILHLALTGRQTGLRIDAVRAFGSVLGSDLKTRTKDMIRVMEADPDFEVRLAAVEELGALGPLIKDDKDALSALRKRLSDPQVKVREAAAVAIRRVEKKADKAATKKP